MRKTSNILIAGFGGQGVLFAGKFLAYKGIIEDKNVSWLPSYGPEMRGGTANCSVIISENAVGSPIVNKPDILIAMNLPSLDKYEDTVAQGGQIYIDSSLIDRKVKRTDVEAFYIPATKLADENGLSSLANMIIMGKMIKEGNAVEYDNVEAALKKVVSARKANLFDFNLKALQMGYDY